jgi:hypothetical protein
MKIKRCDNCGKFNPPIFENNPRLCAACAVPNGFYALQREKNRIGANGKISYWHLQFPIRISWRGWWDF